MRCNFFLHSFCKRHDRFVSLPSTTKLHHSRYFETLTYSRIFLYPFNDESLSSYTIGIFFPSVFFTGFLIQPIWHRFAIENPSLTLLTFFVNVFFSILAANSNVEPIESPRCPDNLLDGCTIQCKDNNYALDYAGCPVCACVPSNAPSRFECPMFKCRANCGIAGYQIDENGCQTCNCATAEIVKPTKVECSRVMCRMFCVHGFRRDENGCEICRCNDSPQPCPDLNCESSCPNGYRKDYSGKPLNKWSFIDIWYDLALMSFLGCQTCTCEEGKGSQNIVQDGCAPMTCALECKYGYERDPSGCSLCSCNRCPVQMCRMFCMYGFKKNSDGCDVCECNWSPVAEKIACSEVNYNFG